MILEQTVKLLHQICKSRMIPPPQVNKVVIGLSYTGVELASFSHGMVLGLAYTLPEVLSTPGCHKNDFAGKLTEIPLNEILEWSFVQPSLKRVIGIAALNAFSQYVLMIKNPYKTLKQDLLKFLGVRKDSRVTFIGLIKPLIRKVASITDSITIIERNIKVEGEFKDYYVADSINEIEREEISTDVLFCTGTALINGTMREILEIYKSRAGRIAVLGPTASMLPDILFDHGVDVVGGMNIKTLRVLKEAGGTKIFKKYGKKYNLAKK